MKKIIYSIIALIVLVFITIYGVLFTSFGNSFIKDLAQKKINESGVISVNITEFELSFSKINLDLLVNGVLGVKVNGNLSLLGMNMDLDYLIEGKNLEVIKINEPINVKGKMAGKFSDFNIDGKGVIFTSLLTLNANVKEYFPTTLSLSANELNVEKLSKLAGFDYASGFININANVDEVNKENLDAKAKINLYSELKLKPSVSKDFGIDVSRFGKIIIDSKNFYTNNTITPNLNVKSNILNITSKFNPIDLNKLEVNGKIITKLSELAFINASLNSNMDITSNIYYKGDVLNINSTITGKNINSKSSKITHNLANNTTNIIANIVANAGLVGLSGGKIANLDANVNLDKNGLKNANAKGNMLGANADIKLANNELVADIKGLKTLTLLRLLKQDQMFDANIDINAKLSDFAKQIGDVKVAVNGKTIPAYFKKEYDLDVISKVIANANVKLNGADNISFNAKLNTDLVDSFNANGSYKNGVARANYNASANLANFNKMLNKKMSGAVAINGDLMYGKILSLSLKSNEFFNGSLNANLKGDNLSAKLNNVALESLAKSFDFIDIYRANVSGDLNYNLKSSKGKLVANVGQGYLKPHKSINLLNLVLKTDITKVVFDKGNAIVDINKNLIDYKANLVAKNANIDVSNGTYNTISKQVNAPIVAIFNGNEIKGKFHGSSDNMKFQPDVKNTIENTAKIIDKLTGKNNSEKLEKTRKPVEKLLNNLFGGKK